MTENRLNPTFPSLKTNTDLPTGAPPQASGRCFGRGEVLEIASAPDGKRLAVATANGLLWYEFPTLEVVDMWDTDQGMIATLSFSADGRWIATGGFNGSVKVWEISSRTCITHVRRCKEHSARARQNEISRVAFSPDLQYLAVSGRRDYIVDLWHPQTGAHLGKINADSQIEIIEYCGLIRPIAFSLDSQLFACLSPSVCTTSERSGSVTAESISIWSLSTGECRAVLEKYPISTVWHSLCFSPSGNHLIASSNTDPPLQIWDTGSWHPVGTPSCLAGDRIIPSYAPTGVLCAAAVSYAKETVTLWDIENRQKRWTSPFPPEFSGIWFFHGNQLIAEGGLEFKTWTTEKKAPQTRAHTHISAVNSLAFSSDGKTIAAGYDYHGILLWNIDAPESPKRRFGPAGKKHRVCSFSKGKFYTISVDENTIRVRELSNDTLSAEITAEKPVTYWGFAFDPETNRLASGDTEGMVNVWDTTRGVHLHTFGKHPSEILRLTFSPNGKFLASEGAVGPDTRLWNVESTKEIHDFPGERIERLAFSPCSTLIAADTDNEILVWDIICSETKLTLPKTSDWMGDGFWQLAFAFSPDDQYLASGGGLDSESGVNPPVRFWELATGRNLATFRGHTREVSALSFSSDGMFLASGGSDGILLLWDLKPLL